jgi:hypothetical protein
MRLRYKKHGIVKKILVTYGTRREISKLGADEGNGSSDDDGDGELHFDGLGGGGGGGDCREVWFDVGRKQRQC